MHSIRSLKIEYRILISKTLILVCNYMGLIAQYCGRTAYKSVQKERTKVSSFAHNPLRGVYSFLNTFLCTVYARITHQLLHTFFMQYQSVNSMLYAQSTGPTITTTYI